VKVYSLSIHADYKCRHSGACCTADWDVPVELPIYRTLDEAIRSGRLKPAPSEDAPLIAESDLPDEAAAMLARTPDGDCVFFHRDSGLCVVHRDLGEDALPSTCRHFPRIAVRDWRGTFITLSHFCPTAASMLFRDDAPLEVVESPLAFPPADYEGLNVHADAWPPLLHPAMLMDLDGYAAWERHMVRRCAAEACSPEAVIATLERDARQLRTWKPGGGPLTDAIDALSPTTEAGVVPPTIDASLAHFAEVNAAIPDDLKPPADEHGLGDAYREYVAAVWPQFVKPLNRFLAAKAFASWTAYQGRGLLSIVRGLEAALAVVRVEAARQCRGTGRALDADLLHEAIRYADFFLNHLAVGENLAERWSEAEKTEHQTTRPRSCA
jgi:Fe-S-cluster containining protein